MGGLYYLRILEAPSTFMPTSKKLGRGKIALVTKNSTPETRPLFCEKTPQDPAISLLAALIAHETFRQV